MLMLFVECSSVSGVVAAEMCDVVFLNSHSLDPCFFFFEFGPTTLGSFVGSPGTTGVRCIGFYYSFHVFDTKILLPRC